MVDSRNHTEPMVQPRYTGIATFMRAPHTEDLSQVDIGMIGVPFDCGVTNRPGARHGPREIRNQSSLIRRMNQTTGVSPHDLCRIADLGDAWEHADDAFYPEPLTALAYRFGVNYVIYSMTH